MMNNKGVVLVIVLWVLLILSLIAWGLGRRSSLEVSLLETYRGKLRSYAAARAGINKMLDLLQRSPSPKDTLYSTGIIIDPMKTPVDIFSHIDTGQNAYASVQWVAQNFNTLNNNAYVDYGLRDEAGRININAINISNYQILSALFQLKDLSQSNADKLAMAIISYATGGSQASGNNSFMDMNDSTIKPKNRLYENILELLEVNGMTQEIFDKIKDDLTVYGEAQNGLRINVDTANNDVIQAVANAAVRLNATANANEIVQAAYDIRDGVDRYSFTSDDGVSSITSLKNPNWPAVLREGSFNYYRARVVGVDADSGARTILEAVIRHTQGAPGEIVSWQRD